MKIIKRASAAGLILLAFADYAIAAGEPAVTLKISSESLGSLPDGYVDDLCAAAQVIWATVSTKENADALATVCNVSMARRKAAGKEPVLPKAPLSHEHKK